MKRFVCMFGVLTSIGAGILSLPSLAIGSTSANASTSNAAKTEADTNVSSTPQSRSETRTEELEAPRGPNPTDLDSYLREFHRNPQKVMNSPLRKVDAQGRSVPLDETPFKQEGLGSEKLTRTDVLKAKDEIRAQLCREAGRNCDPSSNKKPKGFTFPKAPGAQGAGEKPVSNRFAAFSENNQILGFLYESTFLRKPLDMEKAGLQQFVLPTPPWSDSFWPQRKGLIARRWRDTNFPNAQDWMQNYTYYLSMPTILVGTDQLSPAEKYDLLVGDSSFKLTEWMWAQGKYNYDKKGSVPGWAGLCHGWAPAAIMAPNPEKSIVVRAHDGREITFYPSDLKALASLAWGESRPKTKQVGKRCDLKQPKEDAAGRVIDEPCFDVNPGTWHMAVVNQIGVNKRSFVFDATYDDQVWNYPIAAYQYQYFNPQTLATSKTLAGSIVRINDFSIDKFKTYRSPDAKYVVGIAMDLTYSVPTQPSSKPVKKGSFHTVKYVYDLELDASGSILGGEWYSNFHPDFIWNLPVDGRTLSKAELNMSTIPTWNPSEPLPESLRDAAREASQRGQPLATVVDALLALAKNQDVPR